MPRPLSQQTLVITGASSGIGLATAEAAAARGARLVLCARNEAALQSIADRLRQRHRCEVLVAAADVAVRREVDQVAARAIETFGAFDTWINNAGVTWIGSALDDWSEADARRLFDTNFWGVVHGSLAAVAHLRQRGGTLINIASMLADRSAPMQTIYSASKHAVKGFSDGLRQELLAAGAPVHVVLVKPASIATPLIEHAAHPPGRRPRLPSPLYSPDDAAAAILAAAERPQRDVYIGSVARAVGVVGSLLPEALDAGARLVADSQWRDEQSPGGAGNLSTSSTDSHGRSLGHHPGQTIRTSVYTRVDQQTAALSSGLRSIAGSTATLVFDALRSAGRRRR